MREKAVRSESVNDFTPSLCTRGSEACGGGVHPFLDGIQQAPKDPGAERARTDRGSERGLHRDRTGDESRKSQS